MKFKALKHIDGMYGFISPYTILKVENPQLFDCGINEDILKNFFKNLAKKEEILEGWKFITLSVTEIKD